MHKGQQHRKRRQVRSSILTPKEIKFLVNGVKVCQVCYNSRTEEPKEETE
jgi:hypothetical protein